MTSIGRLASPGLIPSKDFVCVGHDARTDTYLPTHNPFPAYPKVDFEKKFIKVCNLSFGSPEIWKTSRGGGWEQCNFKPCYESNTNGQGEVNFIPL